MKKGYFGSLLNSPASPPPPPAFDGIFLFVRAQSNGTNRYKKTGNLPLVQQGPLTDIYNWAYNAGSPHFSALENGPNSAYGTNIISSNPVATLDFNNVNDCFSIPAVMAYNLKAKYGLPVYVVNCAIGGTGMHPFFLSDPYTPACWDSNTRGSLYDISMSLIQAAWTYAKTTLGLNLMPVEFFSQGENDASSSSNQTVADAYNGLLTDFRNNSLTDLTTFDSAFANFPMLISALRGDTILYTYRDTIMKAQVDVCHANANCHLIDMNSDLTPLSSDHEHYTPIVDNYVGQLAAVNAGEIFADFFHKYVYTTLSPTGFIQATGGIIEEVGDYRFHYLNHPSLFRIHKNETSQTFEACIVGPGGGGGTGGGTAGAPGGGGEVKIYLSYVGSERDFLAYPGRGVTDAFNPIYTGNKGNDTVFDGITAKAGGPGGGYEDGSPGNTVNGVTGGPGGGGANYKSGYGPINGQGAIGTPGYKGGDGYQYTGGDGGAGGGGSSRENGENGTITFGGNGARGVDFHGKRYGSGGGGSFCSSAGNVSKGLSGDDVDLTPEGWGLGEIRTVRASTQGKDFVGMGAGGSCTGTKKRGGHGCVVIYYKFK